MANFFEKPVNEISADDVATLVSSAWPETYTLEYKRSLPHKSGGTDPWDAGRDEIGPYARDEILAEVVGLANSDGGYLILGIDETKEKPPRAVAVVAQRDVRDLARRFEDQARACIDPPIATLVVHPVETSGKNGVVIFKVSASRLAPHRLNGNRECFVRRGSRNERMNNDFYTGEARRVRRFLESTELKLETFGKRAKFIVGRQSIDDHEIDDLVLGPLEAVGIFYSKGAIDLPSAYEVFGTCVIEMWENSVVQEYIVWQRSHPHGVDMYDKLQMLYRECTNYEIRKNS